MTSFGSLLADQAQHFPLICWIAEIQPSALVRRGSKAPGCTFTQEVAPYCWWLRLVAEQPPGLPERGAFCPLLRQILRRLCVSLQQSSILCSLPFSGPMTLSSSKCRSVLVHSELGPILFSVSHPLMILSVIEDLEPDSLRLSLSLSSKIVSLWVSSCHSQDRSCPHHWSVLSALSGVGPHCHSVRLGVMAAHLQHHHDSFVRQILRPPHDLAVDQGPRSSNLWLVPRVWLA